MNQSDTLTDLGRLLTQSLVAIQQADTQRQSRDHEPKLHMSSIGYVLSAAYEQLRNASENIEDHLIFQRAMLRFYKRNISFIDKQPLASLGTELVTELTQAGYLDNDTVSASTIQALDGVITTHYQLYWQLIEQQPSLARETAQQWILELLIVRSERLFHDAMRILAFAHLAQTHFSGLIQVHDHTSEHEQLAGDDYAKVLYIAIHRALLKSDDANIRCALNDLYQVPPDNLAAFVTFNQRYDDLAQTKTVVKLARIVNRNGAPLRIVRAAFFEKEAVIDPSVLNKATKIDSLIDAQIDEEYYQARRRMTAGVVKSVIFLLITKALIGLLIEIPYDIIVYGTIIMLPLLINLFFPPLFIAVTALTFKLPKAANKRALKEYVDTMLFVQKHPRKLAIKVAQPTGRSYAFNILYGLMFAAAFYLVIDRLVALQFNLVQGAIFFIFLSTASFLGYRLTLMVKELEIVTTSQGVIALLRDFLYAPFIFLGQRISYRFAKMNIVAQILDMVIELPLKTILRLTRQWTVFLNNKKDELL